MTCPHLDDVKHLRFDDALRLAITRNLALRAASPLPARELKRAAVSLIVTDDGAGGAALVLTLRAKHLSAHSGQFALPGGRVEAGESAIDAAPVSYTHLTLPTICSG